MSNNNIVEMYSPFSIYFSFEGIDGWIPICSKSDQIQYLDFSTDSHNRFSLTNLLPAACATAIGNYPFCYNFVYSNTNSYDLLEYLMKSVLQRILLLQIMQQSTVFVRFHERKKFLRHGGFNSLCCIVL